MSRAGLALVVLVGIVGASAQVSDGDENFQVVHQDIGRISSSGSPVAPPTSIRHEQRAAAAPVRSPATPAPAPAASRKPQRVQLAVRPERHHAAETQLEPVVPAPPAAYLQAAPSAAPVAAAPPPVFRPVVQLSRPLAQSSSISARHAALVAQVNAERQQQQQQQQQQAPLAQVQPPAEPAAAAPAASFLDRPEEPLGAPSFESVLGRGCPHKGVFSWENKDHCDRYYMCTNGTFTEEACPNGLAYSQMGAVYQHCAYNWNVHCGTKTSAGPIASPGCPWQFGIFPIHSNGQCSVDYFVCEWGVPETRRCSPEGLFYDERIKGCQWADQLGCNSEALLNFKCPPEDEGNPYWPYPRYYHTNKDIIVCVNEQPRLTHCAEDQLVEPSSLACLDVHKKKPKKKF